MTDSPLDHDFDDSAPAEDEISKADALAGYMAGLGFHPKTARAKDTLEYAKIYSDPSGRISRTVIVVKKDELGLEPQALDYAAVTIQLHIPATDADVQKAPGFCRQDILRVLAYFDSPSDRSETEVVECGLCGMRVAEFTMRHDEKICLDCSKRKGNT